MDLPRKGDAFPQVMDTGDVGHHTLDTQTESGMGEGTVAAQVEIPLEGFTGQTVLLDLVFEEREIRRPFPTTDDLPVTLGRENIHGKRKPIVLWITSHVEGFDRRRETVDDERRIELLGQPGLVRGSEVATPLERVIEVFVTKSLWIVGKEFGKIKLPNNSFIGSVIRGTGVMKPTQFDIVRPGDRLIIFTGVESLKKIDKLFMRSRKG